MRKSDKKTEALIVKVLTEACEESLKAFHGFQWLTHLVNYQAFPQSLTIICIFDTGKNLDGTLSRGDSDLIKAEIKTRLQHYDLNIKDLERRILFDTEEACEQEHSGNWTKRFKGLNNARHV